MVFKDELAIVRDTEAFTVPGNRCAQSGAISLAALLVSDRNPLIFLTDAWAIAGGAEFFA